MHRVLPDWLRPANFDPGSTFHARRMMVMPDGKRRPYGRRLSSVSLH